MTPYRHDNLRLSFEPLFAALRAVFSATLEPAPSRFLSNRKFGVSVAVVADKTLFGSAEFVLAVRAEIAAEDLRRMFPMQTKIGPVEKIRDLVNLQLPGIALRALPVAPRQIPYHSGFAYFALDQDSRAVGTAARLGRRCVPCLGHLPGHVDGILGGQGIGQWPATRGSTTATAHAATGRRRRTPPGRPLHRRRLATTADTGPGAPRSARWRRSARPRAIAAHALRRWRRDQPGGFLCRGNNVLLQSATPLLVLAQRLRGTVSVPDVGGLRHQVFEELRTFENRARGAGVERRGCARRTLHACAPHSTRRRSILPGEHRVNGPGRPCWWFSPRSLRRREVLLDPRSAAGRSARYIDLMELMFACIVLGFEGRYRLDERGAAQLAEVQRDLYQRIQMQRGPVPADLSPHWQGLTDRRNRVARFVPLWIVALGALAILVVSLYFSTRGSAAIQSLS